MSRSVQTDPTTNGRKADEWLPLEAAAARTGRSTATIKRLVFKGVIGKRLVPVAGQRPQAQVFVPDLERALQQSVQVPATGGSLHRPAPNALAKLHQNDAISALVPMLAKLGEAAERRAALDARRAEREERRAQFEQVERKLTWNLREAREMTGLSRPALRELLAAHPELAIRRGRRVWVKAGKLREVLG